MIEDPTTFELQPLAGLLIVEPVGWQSVEHVPAAIQGSRTDGGTGGAGG